MQEHENLNSHNNEDAKEFLAFTLGREEYGIDILKVQEIKGYNDNPITKIANTPVFIKGVINLRGIIVPVIDMRVKFNLDSPEYSDTTVVIILNIKSNNKERVVGMVVDGVSDVINLKPSQIKPAPEFDGSLRTDYISGLGSVSDESDIESSEYASIITNSTASEQQANNESKSKEKKRDRMVILVDIEKLMTSKDMELVNEVIE